MTLTQRFDESVGSIFDWLATWVLGPFCVLVVVAMAGGVLFGIGYGIWYWAQPAGETVTLNAKFWTCSQSHQAWQPPYSCGAKISRTCGGYHYTRCDQWTAK